MVDSRTTCFSSHSHPITAAMCFKTVSHKYLFESVYKEHCTLDLKHINHVIYLLLHVFLQALSMVLAVF